MKAIDLKITTDKGQVTVSFALVNKNDLNSLTDLLDVPLDITIEKEKKRRTLTANAYMWQLANSIAIKLKSTKEEIYRHAIKQVGTFELVPIRNDIVDKWIANWESKGEGWVCEELRESKIEGYKTMQCYYGSSTYSSKEMSVLVDYIVTEAKELGIETMSTEELKRLIETKA